MPTFSVPHVPVLLIVDDDSNNIQALALALEEHYELRFAMSAEEALEQVHTHPLPDLILLDVMLPGTLDGYGICRKIKSIQATRDIPVIFVTALGHPEAEEKGFLAGGVDYISKPFSPTTVRVRVRNQLEMKRSRELLQRLSLTDPLTQLANRRHFSEAFTQECLRQQRTRHPLSLILLDIDHFKSINDEHGHAVGDVCLQEVASVIAASPYRTADLAARIGGEEFAILLPETDLDGASVIAERIRGNVASRIIRHPDKPLQLQVTVSLGVASSMNGNESQLYESADRQLYQAKANGRNRASIALG
ncbi:GGDEF domain-containing response regulator [Chitinilyticum piscinae]|uniref:GGDEF domain-containing response regulator n=1 Tax=Chitinilyticum piscinae TaxID=2866724 RepID=UPI0027E477E5|nr:diguanylate cyclase [Chitinilyticum piscinae]